MHFYNNKKKDFDCTALLQACIKAFEHYCWPSTYSPSPRKPGLGEKLTTYAQWCMHLFSKIFNRRIQCLPLPISFKLCFVHCAQESKLNFNGNLVVSMGCLEQMQQKLDTRHNKDFCHDFFYRLNIKLVAGQWVPAPKPRGHTNYINMLSVLQDFVMQWSVRFWILLNHVLSSSFFLRNYQFDSSLTWI